MTYTEMIVYRNSIEKLFGNAPDNKINLETLKLLARCYWRIHCDSFKKENSFIDDINKDCLADIRETIKDFLSKFGLCTDFSSIIYPDKLTIYDAMDYDKNFTLDLITGEANLIYPEKLNIFK